MNIYLILYSIVLIVFLYIWHKIQKINSKSYDITDKFTGCDSGPCYKHGCTDKKCIFDKIEE